MGRLKGITVPPEGASGFKKRYGILGGDILIDRVIRPAYIAAAFTQSGYGIFHCCLSLYRTGKGEDLSIDAAKKDDPVPELGFQFFG